MKTDNKMNFWLSVGHFTSGLALEGYKYIQYRNIYHFFYFNKQVKNCTKDERVLNANTQKKTMHKLVNRKIKTRMKNTKHTIKSSRLYFVMYT